MAIQYTAYGELRDMTPEEEERFRRTGFAPVVDPEAKAAPQPAPPTEPEEPS
jgi:hypothetical protein